MSGASNSRVISLARDEKPPADGETLAFIVAAFKRVMVSEYRDVLLGKVRDVEKRVSEIDEILASDGERCAMDALAAKVGAVHADLAVLLSTLDHPNLTRPSDSNALLACLGDS